MSEPRPVVYAMPRSELGGSQRSLLLLLRGLDRVAFPPRVFLGEDGPLARSLEALAVPFELARASFRSPRVVPQFIRFARGARLLHLFGARTLAIAARASGMKVVERVNLLRSKEAGGLVKNPALDRLLLKLSDFIVVPAQAMEEQLLDRGVPEARLRLIPNGVHLEAPSAPRSDLRVRLGLAEDALVFLSVARLHPMKGLDELLRAFVAVREALPGAVLLLAGEGSERASLETLARELGVPARFLGDRTDVADLLEAADVYVQASRHSEVLSNSVLEAMLAGRAVVATDVGGTREAVRDGETGVLVPRCEAAALAGALVALGRDPERRARLAAGARDLVKREFSIEAMARAHEAVYREALGGAAA